MDNKPVKSFAFRLFVATIVRKFRILLFNLKGYNFPYNVIIEGGVVLDKLNKKGITIGENTLVASGSKILSHDHCKRTTGNAPFFADTSIGSNCFIAINAVILPGVAIGDQVIVGAGAVVTKNVPSNSIVAGNPAKIIRQNIKMNNFAALENWNEQEGWLN